jgi:ATP-dependent Clp protease protease subunit
MVVERTSEGERGYDIFSRLLKERIIVFAEDVNELSSSLLIAQLLFLDSNDPGKEIKLHIHSPGGEVYSGLAVYDTLQKLKSPVQTVSMGLSASMASIFLAAGTPGLRASLPNSTIMIHQPSSGTQGKITDMEIDLVESIRLKNKLIDILHKHCGGKTERDALALMMERNKWLTPEEALQIGIIDIIL